MSASRHTQKGEKSFLLKVLNIPQHISVSLEASPTPPLWHCFLCQYELQNSMEEEGSLPTEAAHPLKGEGSCTVPKGTCSGACMVIIHPSKHTEFSGGGNRILCLLPTQKSIPSEEKQNQRNKADNGCRDSRGM